MPTAVAFDVDVAMRRIREAVRPFPKAALFELAGRGYDSPFQQLVACLISVRTRDETSLPVAIRLFEVARTPSEVAALTVAEIVDLLEGTAFRHTRAVQLHSIATRTVEEYGGEVPCDFERLTAFDGIGPKCANLALSNACDQPSIGVDVHEHRVTNRWGYVHTKTPEATRAALEVKLPRAYWVSINELLVPFGKHICTGIRPHCSTCPVLEMCAQVGVTTHR